MSASTCGGFLTVFACLSALGRVRTGTVGSVESSGLGTCPTLGMHLLQVRSKKQLLASDSQELHIRSQREVMHGGRPQIKFKSGFKTKIKGRVRGPRAAVITDGDNVHMNLSEKATPTKIATCDEPFAAPDKLIVQCPALCPLMRFDEHLLCHWRCISEQRCRTYPSNVVSYNTGMCSVCAVPGCNRCSNDYSKCETCTNGYDLSNGICVSTSRYYWYLFASVLVFLVAFFLFYSICLAWRPVLSLRALEWALEYRSRTRPRLESRRHELIPLSKNLARTHTSAGGIGILLYFSWQRMVLLWGVIVVIVMGSVSLLHQRIWWSDLTLGMPGHDELYGVCERILNEEKMNSHVSMHIHVKWATGFLYIFSTLGSIFVAVWHRRKYWDHEETHLNMRHYALLCKGFPVETEAEGVRGRNDVRLEEEYREFLVSTWGESVLGVSIVWDLDDRIDDVHSMIAHIIDGLHQKHGQYPGELLSTSLAQNTSSHDKKTRTTCFFEPALEFVDNLWWSGISATAHKTSPSLENAEDDSEINAKDEANKLLAELKTTGYLFAVFHTEQNMLAAMSNPLPKFRDQFAIKVERTNGDAEVVTWESFTTSSRQRVRYIVHGCLLLAGVMTVWTCCFWAPYTYYILVWSDTAGASQGTFLGGLLLGLLITVGNQLVYTICAHVAEEARFTCRDHRDLFYVLLYTFSVLLNTLLDMWLVEKMSVGYQLDTAADPTSLVRNPSMQHAIYTQLVFYLWPCTLLLPFALEPLVTNVVPYFLGKWLVRSKANASHWEAEQCLALPPFDLSRYGDILVNVTLVMFFFFLTSKNIWWIFLVMTISHLWIYVWDDFRFKRGTCRTHFATQDVEILSQYMSVLPCAILAGAVMFKYYGGQALVRSWAPDQFLRGHPEIWIVVGIAFLSHIIVHSLILAVVVPYFERTVKLSSRQHQKNVPYMKTAANLACNWFNANPVHCLRSKYLYCHDPPHVFYMPGKEHLLRRNTREEDRSALILYEHTEFAEEASLLDELFGRGSSISAWSAHSSQRSPSSESVA